MSARPVVLVCGGGTGGHVFPGLAIAERLRALADVEVVFVGTERGMETRLVPEAGYRLELLDVEPMKGGGPARLLRGALIAARATRAADALVARHAPRIVVSVGGYAAGPASLAAVRRRVPLVVVEPNAQLGLANRILAPFAERGYVAWSKTGRHFRSGRSRTFGVPLRRGFSPRPYVAGATLRLLVVGGSQGAAWLNEHVPSIVSVLRQRHPSLVVLHQSGRDRDVEVRARYEALGVSAHATVVPFLSSLDEELARADVVVARSGAGLVAEITAVGRAAVFVPFPRATDDHQAKNALALVEEGAAACVRQEEGPSVLADAVSRLLDDGRLREAMAAAARSHGKPHAADEIARDLLVIARIASNPRSTHGAPGRERLHSHGRED